MLHASLGCDRPLWLRLCRSVNLCGLRASVFDCSPFDQGRRQAIIVKTRTQRERMHNAQFLDKYCRGRQSRLLEVMNKQNLDAVLVNQRENVQWLTGCYFPYIFHPVALLRADGQLTLVAPNQAPASGCFDEVATYEAQWHATLRNDQPLAVSEALKKTLSCTFERLGVEFSSSPHYYSTIANERVDVEAEMFRLRRQKFPDEIAHIEIAVSGTERMYERAREIIEPGVSEIRVFNELQAAAVEQFGEMLTGTGNDYQCGSPGGKPRHGRLAEAGELYILDLGPGYRGYFADNCRTIAVTDVSDEQQAAWDCVMKVFDHVEQAVRPGKNAKELFEEADAILSEAPIGKFIHHLGHGIGLFPHEAPHLNPNWDDTFQVDEVFTVEPGLYADELRGGMRIENNYVVEEDGIRKLTNFTCALKV